MDYTPVSTEEFSAESALADWRMIGAAAHATFAAGGFSAAAALLLAFAEAADAADHHPDLDLRYPDLVHVVLSSHATGGVTRADVALAGQYSTLASAAGAAPQPAD